MGFHFNPSLWFVCKLCRKTFPDTEKLKAHKLESHLSESLNIKCIVFEEKLLDHEWIPPSPEYISKHDELLKLGCALTSEIHDGNVTDINNPLTEFIGQNQKQIKFANPYVSLKRVTVQELNSATSASAAKIDTAGTRPKAGKYCDNFESTETIVNLFAKQKQSLFSESEVSSFPSKLPIKTADDDPGDVHKNKIRELLSNAVIIKSEPNNDTDNQVFLKPQDLPISIVSAYSLSPSSYKANIPTDPLNTPVPVPVPGTASIKMEIIDSDLITNQNVEIISSKEQPEQLQFDVKPDLLGFLESASYSGESTAVARAQNTFGCQRNASFGNKHCLAQHYTDTAFKCSDCDMAFTSKNSLQRHLIARHGQATNFKCRSCGKCFTTRRILWAHEATHTGYRPFKCHFQGCAAAFASQTYLHCHRRSVHGKDLGLPQFACSICEKSYGLRKHLNTHTRTVHKT